MSSDGRAIGMRSEFGTHAITLDALESRTLLSAGALPKVTPHHRHPVKPAVTAPIKFSSTQADDVTAPDGSRLLGVTTATGDFNHDKKLDLISYGSDASGKAVLAIQFGGKTAGTFGAPGYVSLPGHGGDIAAGDFDGDGTLDFVVTEHGAGANGSDAVQLFLGQGNGKFTLGPTLAAGVNANSPVAIDANGDGRTDLAWLDARVSGTTPYGQPIDTTQLAVSLAGKKGRFAAPTFTDIADVYSPVPHSLTAGDVTGDGKADLLATSGYLYLLTNTGGGTFSAPRQLVGSNGPAVVADVNGDGRPDVLTPGSVLDAPVDAVTVSLGQKGGTLSAPASYGAISTGGGIFADATDVVVGDYNGDGKPDVAATVWSNGTPGVVTLQGNGDGTFADPVTQVAPGAQPWRFAAAADLNGDGKDDLLVPATDGYVVLLT